MQLTIIDPLSREEREVDIIYSIVPRDNSVEVFLEDAEMTIGTIPTLDGRIITDDLITEYLNNNGNGEIESLIVEYLNNEENLIIYLACTDIVWAERWWGANHP